MSEATSGFGTELRIGSGGAGATRASRTVGAGNSALSVTAKQSGAAGNSVSFAVVVGGTSTALSVGVTGNAITVNSATDGGGLATSTVNDIVAAIYDSPAAAALIDASNGAGNGTGVIVAAAPAALAGGTDSAETFSKIAEVRSLSGPNMSASTVDISNMDSLDRTREFISSLVDPGEFTFDCNFLPSNANQQGLMDDLLSGVKRNFQVVWTDEELTTWNFQGIVTAFGPSAGIEDALSLSVTIKVTGATTIS